MYNILVSDTISTLQDAFDKSIMNSSYDDLIQIKSLLDGAFKALNDSNISSSNIGLNTLIEAIKVSITSALKNIESQIESLKPSTSTG